MQRKQFLLVLILCLTFGLSSVFAPANDNLPNPEVRNQRHVESNFLRTVPLVCDNFNTVCQLSASFKLVTSNLASLIKQHAQKFEIAYFVQSLVFDWLKTDFIQFTQRLPNIFKTSLPNFSSS